MNKLNSRSYCFNWLELSNCLLTIKKGEQEQQQQQQLKQEQQR